VPEEGASLAAADFHARYVAPNAPALVRGACAEWGLLQRLRSPGAPGVGAHLAGAYGGARVSVLRVNTGPDAARFATVLHHVAGKNFAAIIPRVLATGVLDVDVRAGPAAGCERCTPLHMAAMHDAPLAVSALLAGGASLSATDARSYNALQLAISCSSAKAARPLVEATPRAARARYQREAAAVVAERVRDAAARPGDAAAAAKLAAARAIAALLA
jgi:hypothetical protein